MGNAWGSATAADTAPAAPAAEAWVEVEAAEAASAADPLAPHREHPDDSDDYTRNRVMVALADMIVRDYAAGRRPPAAAVGYANRWLNHTRWPHQYAQVDMAAGLGAAMLRLRYVELAKAAAAAWDVVPVVPSGGDSDDETEFDVSDCSFYADDETYTSEDAYDKNETRSSAEDISVEDASVATCGNTKDK